MISFILIPKIIDYVEVYVIIPVKGGGGLNLDFSQLGNMALRKPSL